jgi:hypothetical protein
LSDIEAAPHPHIFVISITVDAHTDEVECNFSGLAYWAMRGIMERTIKMIREMEPDITIHNMDQQTEEVDDDE